MLNIKNKYMINLDEILLSHFRQNGLKLYRSKEKIKKTKTSHFSDIKSDSGKVISVNIAPFKVTALVDGEIKSILLADNKDGFTKCNISCPFEAEQLIGLSKSDKLKIESWKRCRNWKEGETVSEDWLFTIESYDYSDSEYFWNKKHYRFQKRNNSIEVLISGENILKVEADLSDNNLVEITFKDEEGYTQRVVLDIVQ